MAEQNTQAGDDITDDELCAALHADGDGPFGYDDYVSMRKSLNAFLRVRQASAQSAAPAKMFRIMGGRAIPWSVIEPFEHRALLNHGQSLQRLSERGGLDPTEALAVLRDVMWRDVSEQGAEAVLALEALIRERVTPPASVPAGDGKDAALLKAAKEFAATVVRFGETSHEGMFDCPSSERAPALSTEHLNVQFMVTGNFGHADALFAAMRPFIKSAAILASKAESVKGDK